LSSVVGFAAPPYPAFRLANDKLATARHAEGIGLSVPRVYSDAQEADLDAIARDVRFPVVIKARSGSGVTAAMVYAGDGEALRRGYAALVGRSGEAGRAVRNFRAPLIQEYVPGHIHDVCTVSWQGEVIAALTQVRQVMSPIDGGVGAVNRTTDEPELRALAVRLLESLDWQGPAQVEFKRDARDGRWRLIEVNPKLWGTLPLSIAAGLCFPAIIRDLVMGRRVVRMPSYRVGLRQVFLFPQATQALWQLGRRFGWRRVWGARGVLWPDVVDVDWRDPVPDLRRAVGAVARLVRVGVDESWRGWWGRIRRSRWGEWC
jgi:predicted ATP-grasp superfamily ATP-dependent carboligase